MKQMHVVDQSEPAVVNISERPQGIKKWLGDMRDEEYRVAKRFLEGCDNILDVGCGTGTFLSLDPGKIIGIDINPDNVTYCRARGLTAHVGNALNIDFPENSFDGAFASHLMHVFQPTDAVQFLRELGRIVKPNGVIVISTLNWFKRFFRHPENARPYPPDALWRLFSVQKGAVSPMFPDLHPLQQEAIWLRRTPLIEFYSSTNYQVARLASVSNLVQYRLYLRKYWNYDSYTIKLRNLKLFS